MQPNTEAIIRLAWSRSWGLDDTALAIEQGGRIEVPRDDMAGFVRLWEREVSIGPAWFLERTASTPADDLADGANLLGILGAHGGRLLGQADLAYADAYVTHEGSDDATVTEDPAAVVDLERMCPSDDVSEVGLSDMSGALVVLDELDRCTAGAGYQEVQGILAQLGVLTPPSFRRQGHGTLAAAITVNNALDAGLVPQWRSRVGNFASAALARRLGFTAVGSQTTVLLPVPDPGRTLL